MTDGQRDALKEGGANMRLLLGAAIAVLVPLVAWIFNGQGSGWLRAAAVPVGLVVWRFAWWTALALDKITDELEKG